MSIEVKVPVLPESVADATVASWHKQPGDRVSRDENLVDLETDKVVLEVPAPADGILKEITQEAGATVTSGQVMAILEEGAAEEAPAAAAPAEAPAAAAPAPAAPAAPAASSDEPKGIAPAARKLAAEEGVNTKEVEGSGRGGRVTKADVIKHVRGGGARQEERVKMTRLRSRVAERMKEAQNTAAILTSFNEVNMSAVMDLRSRFKAEFEKTHGIKLGFMSFFVKACCEALQKHPVVNASVEGDEIIYHGFMDVGIAVSTERGLVVPILRDAHLMSLAEIESQLAEYAGQARKGTIGLDSLQGGTFTITNGGVFGSLLSTPLLNPPQSAILGMHTIKERPVVENGEIVAAPMMYIALSYDHRIIDGKDAVQFLVAVKEALEDPARMLLNL
ncbi:MAG: 2-oxoglutarate dehydrogenase complex dihydrolipoyllysine-residue succinyltransferase [Xanthomonadales bacterium]|nr:2-oxoglutarate dehydrogenase complex dihydrolipoyllysine-residue succinyltransferase [Xanthomonadales bacterium]